MSELNTADVIGVDPEGGDVRLRLGSVATEDILASNVSLVMSGGFVSVPNLPDAEGNSCQVVYVKDGDEFYAIGSRDNRFRSLMGSLQAGDCAVFSDCTSRMLLKQGNDTISLYAENQKSTPAGATMLMQHDAPNGKTMVMNGGAFIRMTDNGPGTEKIELIINGGSSITLTKSGIELKGGDITIVGGFVRIGDAGGGNAPPPGPALGAAVGVAGPVNTVSTKVSIAI